MKTLLLAASWLLAAGGGRAADDPWLIVPGQMDGPQDDVPVPRGVTETDWTTPLPVPGRDGTCPTRTAAAGPCGRIIRRATRASNPRMTFWMRFFRTVLYRRPFPC